MPPGSDTDKNIETHGQRHRGHTTVASRIEASCVAHNGSGVTTAREPTVVWLLCVRRDERETATHCNTLRHTATHRSTLQQRFMRHVSMCDSMSGEREINASRDALLVM